MTSASKVWGKGTVNTLGGLNVVHRFIFISKHINSRPSFEMVANAAICRNANILECVYDPVIFIAPSHLRRYGRPVNQSFAVNTRGLFLRYQYAKQMVKQGLGDGSWDVPLLLESKVRHKTSSRISSWMTLSLLMMSLYGATKSAIRALTQRDSMVFTTAF